MEMSVGVNPLAWMMSLYFSSATNTLHILPLCKPVSFKWCASFQKEVKFSSGRSETYGTSVMDLSDRRRSEREGGHRVSRGGMQ
jgi:hypothetical protein